MQQTCLTGASDVSPTMSSAIAASFATANSVAKDCSWWLRSWKLHAFEGWMEGSPGSMAAAIGTSSPLQRRILFQRVTLRPWISF